MDYLIQTGQAPGTTPAPGTLPPSSTPGSFNPTLNPNTLSTPSIPTAPKTSSALTVEMMRQAELQRERNSTRRPDPRELNSRIPDPGTRNF
ncbi:MAG: hypothetical protein HC904_05930 [Blastochloris sp.]|nr:hypothetical protein [Blastochloris sp.]